MIRTRSRSRLGVSLLGAALLVGSFSLQPVLAEDSSSDIPGVPLPGPIVSGSLGGPIYDVVYRLSVPAAHVILIGLTGSTGTDFDLYLFDSSATTVLSNVGLLAKSNGPTSAEQLSWSTKLGGTFYVDLNGATDVLGTYRLSVQIVPDPTPPTATLQVVGGATRVNTQQINLQVIAFDDLSSVTEMSLSADGVNFLPPVPLQTQFPWTLPEGDGPKRVWIRVYNGTGRASAAASVSVELDTTAPRMTAVSPEPDSTVGETRPTISVKFDEPINPESWSNLGLAMQAPSGQIVPGEYAYYPSLLTGTFIPSTDLELGYVYLISLGEVRDTAGNRLPAPRPWTIKRLIPTEVSLVAKPLVVTYGEDVDLTARVSLPDGEFAVFETRTPGSDVYTTEQLLAATDETIPISIVPTTNRWYRLRYAGSATAVASSSPAIRVLVRRKVQLLGVNPATTQTARPGDQVKLTARISPPGIASVSFQLYRYDPARAAYRYAGSFGRKTDATGVAAMTWTAVAGRFYWRVAVLPSPTYANNMTPAHRWSIR